jgi:hypothetical protein
MLSEPLQDERDDLAALIQSAGWKRLIEYGRAEWGPSGYGARMKDAYATGDQQSPGILILLARIDGGSDAVNELLSWPLARLRQLGVP